jgi:hypothetical protein
MPSSQPRVSTPRGRDQQALMPCSDRSPPPNPPPPCHQVLLGVLDGHGTFGHLVSTFLARHLPVTIYQRLSGDAPPGSPPGEPDAAAAAPSSKGGAAAAAAGPLAARPAARDAWAPFGAAFADADRLLCGSGVDVLESGSTAVVCHIDLAAGRLTTAWCGDSRALLASRRGERWRVVALSDDHKPERPDERVGGWGQVGAGRRPAGARGGGGEAAGRGPRGGGRRGAARGRNGGRRGRAVARRRAERRLRAAAAGREGGPREGG